jgi:single-stranded-DNA-specific exonuclease
MKIEKRVVPNSSALAGIPPLLDRVYRSRGVNSLEDIDLSLKYMLPISSLMRVVEGAQLVAETIRKGENIVVVADYDADGATACALSVRALRAMLGDSIGTVNYVVPDRKKHGYGLSPQVVELTLKYSPNLLITVDNGISSIAGVAAAKEAGIKVIVTDHHLPGDELPAADVIINPNQQGDSFISKNLAGVGVAFYLICAVKQALKSDFNPVTLLDLVALGTVADVVPLDYNNRILVKQGVERVRRGLSSAGVAALLEVSNRDIKRVVATDFGFAVGPRINAAGRMAEMGAGIDCLLAESRTEALPQAQRLDEINKQRREVETVIREEAEHIVESLHLSEKGLNVPAGVTLYQSSWHEGVIGIVAGRIKEQLHRPVIVFALSGEDEESGSKLIKGSARSIPGLHLRDLIDLISKREDGLIIKFGGHAMAAGLSIREGDFEKFGKLFEQLVTELSTPELLAGVRQIDGRLTDSERTLASAELLRDAGPWGQQFEEPLFQDGFILDGWRVVGERHLKLTLRDLESGEVLDAIAFNHSPEVLPEQGEELKVVYRLDVNSWRGRESLQLMVEEIDVLKTQSINT